MEDLQWLGLQWDEGVEVGGENGPYRQSERLEIFGEHVAKLLADGNAYYALETPAELDAMREAARAEKRNFRYPRPDPLPTQADADQAAADVDGSALDSGAQPTGASAVPAAYTRQSESSLVDDPAVGSIHAERRGAIVESIREFLGKGK